EGLVFGARAANAMTRSIESAALHSMEIAEWAPVSEHSTSSVPSEEEVRDLMWRYCGLLREGRDMMQASARVQEWYAAVANARLREPSRQLYRLVSFIIVGLLIARASLRRQESRGGHFRTDFPERDDIKWRRHIADRIRARD